MSEPESHQTTSNLVALVGASNAAVASHLKNLGLPTSRPMFDP